MRSFLLAAALSLALPAGAAFAQAITVVDQAPADAVTVSIANMAFATEEVKVKKGGSVTWTNDDEIAHNVHFRNGPAKGDPKAQGKMLNKGESYTVTFGEAGTYDYICTPHPMMKAKVIVE
ncbi:cupredoxin family copper-binding protein [Methylopila sp. 73B]|uniref:cupredoxin domain-containing protein n=1 Tax=Methylopila sp. 73B TaxID=1120792 RepID=UPI0003709EB9|nr:cupredoxin family copper-binding protein [Methylopila sp. 73B]